MKGKKGIGLRYAFNGLREAFNRERNFRIHLCIAVIVICAGIYFKLILQEWLMIVLMIHIVLITELMNSVVERIIDYLRPEYHPKAMVIKDISAAIVLISAITSIIVGCLIFIPKIFPVSF